MTRIGSNTFINCTIPIGFEDRYFVLEQQNNRDIFSVFTLHEAKPVFEIFRNEPQDNPLTEVSKTPPGFITVGQKGEGGFIYKVRPGSRGSSIFGKIKGEETEIKITDTAIYIGTNTFQRNLIVGYEVGITVSRDGSISMGTSLPQEVRHLFVRKQVRQC